MADLTEADLDYLRNINTRPGPGVGQSIDPTRPGPTADRNEQPKGGDAILPGETFGSSKPYQPLTQGPGSECDRSGAAPSPGPQDVRELAAGIVLTLRQYRNDGSGAFYLNYTEAVAYLAERLAALAQSEAQPSSAGPIEAAEWRTIYLAGRYSRGPELRRYRSDLEVMGFAVTSRWIDGGHELTKEGSTQAHEVERTRFAQEDKSDLERAECVISFTEEPRKTTTRGGRHVEFGIALARKQHVIVIGHRENVFHCLPEVEFHDSWAGFLGTLRARAADRGAT